ncbi:hypothetical protein EPN28_02155 [Patescibacteria group bacterium]|nr:MAG: hypothetical protein EPN28_02155 [Patescibacteria group bacterium]
MSVKKIFLIVLLLLVAVLIGIGLYKMFIGAKPAAKIPYQPPAPITPGVLPPSGARTTTGAGVPAGAILPSAGFMVQTSTPAGFYKAEPVTQISADYAVYPSLNQTGGFRYYNAADGKFYDIRNGKITPLSDQVFYNASNVTWAKNRDIVVIEYPDQSKIIYNFETEKQVTLPKHWSEFSFSPEGKEIAAKSIGLAPENRWLVTTRDDGTGTKTIEPMGNNADRVLVDWSPSRQAVAFSRTGEPLGAERQEILLVGLNGENFKSLVVEGENFLPKWSTTGKKLLYSVDSSRTDFNPELWISDAYGDRIGDNRQTLKLNTWADKCAFASDDALYCAVPKELPQGAGMARDIANGLADELYKIDLRTGLKTVVPLGGDYNITNISFDAAKSALYFTDLNKSGVFESKL